MSVYAIGRDDYSDFSSLYFSEHSEGIASIRNMLYGRSTQEDLEADYNGTSRDYSSLSLDCDLGSESAGYYSGVYVSNTRKEKYRDVVSEIRSNLSTVAKTYKQMTKAGEKLSQHKDDEKTDKLFGVFENALAKYRGYKEYMQAKNMEIYAVLDSEGKQAVRNNLTRTIKRHKENPEKRDTPLFGYENPSLEAFGLTDEYV